MKKVRTTSFNVNVAMGIYIDIDDYRFLVDEDYPFVRVELVTDGEIYGKTYDFIDEFECNCTNHEDLKVAAINWIFENVEIVKADEIMPILQK